MQEYPQNPHGYFLHRETGYKMDDAIEVQMALEKIMERSNQIGCLVRQTVDMLDCLMRIIMEGPPVSNFELHPALKSWWNSGPRAKCPNFDD